MSDIVPFREKSALESVDTDPVQRVVPDLGPDPHEVVEVAEMTEGEAEETTEVAAETSEEEAVENDQEVVAGDARRSTTNLRTENMVLQLKQSTPSKLKISPLVAVGKI